MRKHKSTKYGNLCNIFDAVDMTQYLMGYIILKVGSVGKSRINIEKWLVFFRYTYFRGFILFVTWLNNGLRVIGYVIVEFFKSTCIWSMYVIAYFDSNLVASYCGNMWSTVQYISC